MCPPIVKVFNWLLVLENLNANEVFQRQQLYMSLNPGGVFFLENMSLQISSLPYGSHFMVQIVEGLWSSAAWLGPLATREVRSYGMLL